MLDPATDRPGDHATRQTELLTKIEGHLRFVSSIIKLLLLLVFIGVGGLILRLTLYYTRG